STINLQYLVEATIGCWSDEIDEGFNLDMFPPSLLVKNTSISSIKRKIEMAAAERQTTVKQAKIPQRRTKYPDISNNNYSFNANV
ncbi:1881_t:CDS:2, partial [Ambispora leptoticha]